MLIPQESEWFPCPSQSSYGNGPNYLDKDPSVKGGLIVVDEAIAGKEAKIMK
ncbi:hypothetical protein GCM10007216_38130 [Thalassobacillus devorans]|uniref:Uncharacterized protein n=1 Tax=Thalassobacillus devorans TaxID=279813 RepID=A0ABQ1PU90_9BACI|nr:hypothetical protein GCM10007216_38130 [Thalassobacillus devorans]